MKKTAELSEVSVAALEAAGVTVSGLADFLFDGVTDNHSYNNKGQTAGEDWSNWNGISHVVETYGMKLEEVDGEDINVWANVWNDDVVAAVDAELDDMMLNYIRKDFADRIDNADDLEELRDLLNACDKWSDDNGRDRGEIYTSNALPTFGGAEIQDTQNIYSWDDENVLTFREEFVIDARDEEEAAA